jgi:hypothetical protein
VLINACEHWPNAPTRCQTHLEALERVTLDPWRIGAITPPHSSCVTYNDQPGEKPSIVLARAELELLHVPQPVAVKGGPVGE